MNCSSFALVHLSSAFVHPSSALVHPSSASFTPRAPWFTPFVVESVLLIILVFFYVFLVVCLRSVSCAQCWRCPWIVHSWLSLSITSTYIRKILSFITYLVQIKAFLYDQYDRKSTVHIFTPGKITGYWITTRSFPYRGPYWPGPIWASTSSQANMGLF